MYPVDDDNYLTGVDGSTLAEKQMNSLQWRVAETLAPRILYVKGIPMRLVIRPYGRAWSVYDISVTPPTVVVFDASHDDAVREAEKPFKDKE